MENIPVVSIVIPAYNCEKCILKALESIQVQTYQNYEVIVVDDGSTDTTGAILDAYAEENEKITVFHVENGGPSRARNLGIQNAKGEWIQFMDADDVLAENMLENMIASGNHMDVVVCGFNKEYVEQKSIEKRNLESAKVSGKAEIASYLKNMQQTTKEILLNYIWNKLYRKEILIKNGIVFDEQIRLGEDFVFNCQFFSCIESFAAISGNFYNYYIYNTSSLSKKIDMHEAERRERMFCEFTRMLKSYNVFDEMEDSIAYNEGKYCWISMCKIGSKHCSLKWKEKVQYLESLLNERNQKCLLTYFEKRNDCNSKLLSSLIKNKSIFSLAMLLIFKGKFSAT